MEQITDIQRQKKTFHISYEEFRKGEWLERIPESSTVFEVQYKNKFLTISSANIKMKKKQEGGRKK